MSALDHSSLAMGLSDPVFGSQLVFRTLLKAFAAPGTIFDLPETISGVPEQLPSAAAAALLTMADYETPIWLAKPFESIRPWLVFHTGASSSREPAEAKFAVISAEHSDVSLSSFHQGDERYPDLSTTLIVVCSSLEGGNPVTLNGPGIKDTSVFAPNDIKPALWAEIAENNALFPLGVDLIFVAGTTLAALPRSTQINGDF